MTAAVNLVSQALTRKLELEGPSSLTVVERHLLRISRLMCVCEQHRLSFLLSDTAVTELAAMADSLEVVGCFAAAERLRAVTDALDAASDGRDAVVTRAAADLERLYLHARPELENQLLEFAFNPPASLAEVA